MHPRRARAAAPLLAGLLGGAALAGCSAGVDAAPQKAPVGPTVDVGHGSINDVYGKLIERGALCNYITPMQPTDTEELASCEIDGGPAVMVHFNDPDEAARFERSVRDAGQPGVFTPTWAMRLPSEATAERVAQAMGVANRTSG